jgi:hypothetical protein
MDRQLMTGATPLIAKIGHRGGKSSLLECRSMLLAGDIGGFKTLLGLFTPKRIGRRPSTSVSS